MADAMFITVGSKKRRVCVIPACDKQARAPGSTLCNRHYTEKRRAEVGACSVEGCDAPAVRVGAALCERHYYRKRRTGRLDRAPIIGRYLVSAGYVLLLQPEHPLALSSGLVYEHRSVAFDAQDGICGGCFWCGKVLEWDEAVVDHLNDEKDDNRPDNLLVTCVACNRARGSIIGFLRRMRPEAQATFIEWARAKSGAGVKSLKP